MEADLTAILVEGHAHCHFFSPSLFDGEFGPSPNYLLTSRRSAVCTSRRHDRVISVKA
jgi:hypothetical protein